MNFKLLLNIAIHLLRARLKQTVVAAVGVTFGIAMFISLVSFMNGLNDLLDGLMLNRTPHILLYNEIKPSENQPISLSNENKKNTNFIINHNTFHIMTFINNFSFTCKSNFSIFVYFFF